MTGLTAITQKPDSGSQNEGKDRSSQPAKSASSTNAGSSSSVKDEAGGEAQDKEAKLQSNGNQGPGSAPVSRNTSARQFAEVFTSEFGRNELRICQRQCLSFHYFERLQPLFSPPCFFRAHGYLPQIGS